MATNNNYLTRSDPREVEMLAIVNMQPVSDEVRKGIEQLEQENSQKIESKLAAEAAAAEVADTAILTPGTKIRPRVSVDTARILAERMYGIVASDIKELISYDDRNFLIIPDRWVIMD